MDSLEPPAAGRFPIPAFFRSYFRPPEPQSLQGGAGGLAVILAKEGNSNSSLALAGSEIPSFSRRYMKVVANVVLTVLSNFQVLMLSVVAETSKGWPEIVSVPTTSPFSTMTRTRTMPLIRAVLARAGYTGRSPCTRKGYRNTLSPWAEICGTATSVTTRIRRIAFFIGDPIVADGCWV